MDPVQALAHLGGVATFRQLSARTSRGALRTALRRGTVVRLARDRYALAGLDSVQAVAVAAGGVLGGLTAALQHGWKVKSAPVQPCVVVPRGRHRPDGDLDVHWADLDADEVAGAVTARARTVADCCRWLEYDEALCVVDSALRDGLTRAVLLAAAERLPRTGRERARRVIQRGDARADNPFESVTRALAHDVPGLDLEPQVVIPGVGRVDLADRRRKIMVECDSFAFHSSPAQLQRDVRRYTSAVRAGWVVVRFSWIDVMNEPEYVVAVLTDVVATTATTVRADRHRRTA